MPEIKVTYLDDTSKIFNSFEDIIHHELVTEIDCSYQDIRALPESMNFPELVDFDCSNNLLTHMPDKLNLPKLKHINCEYNSLQNINVLFTLPEIENIICYSNFINTLPDTYNLCQKLQYLYCNDNRIQLLPEPLIQLCSQGLRICCVGNPCNKYRS